MLQELSLKNLSEFDFGKLSGSFDAEMKHAVESILRHKSNPSKRKVILTVEIEPDAPDQSTGDIETAQVRFHVKSTVPARVSGKRQCAVRKNGTLVSNDASPDDVRQQTIG